MTLMMETLSQRFQLILKVSNIRCSPRYFSWVFLLGIFDLEEISKWILCSLGTVNEKIKIIIVVQHMGWGEMGGGEPQQEEFWLYLLY